MEKDAARGKPQGGAMRFLFSSFNLCMQGLQTLAGLTSVLQRRGDLSSSGQRAVIGGRGRSLHGTADPFRHSSGIPDPYEASIREVYAKISRTECNGRNIGGTHEVGSLSCAGTSTTAGMRGPEPSRTWTQELCRQGLTNRYTVHREPQWRMEGFKNTGNSCYMNACLQGLLSLHEFTTDLQRKCWVQAMLTPKKSGGAPGDISAGSVSATALSAAGGRQSEDGETGGGVEGDATLYAALLQLTMQAGGPHGVMDASEIKRAIDRRSDRFAGNLQQDAHEFLIDLINTLHEEAQPRVEAAAAFAASTAPSVSASASAFASGNQKQQISDVVGRAGVMAVGRQGGNEAGSLREEASSERIIPTTRHFHAEVEVTLTCTRCAYSRRRRELCRDFSLDVPHLPEGEGEGALGLSELLDGFFKPSVLDLRCHRCDSDQVLVERSLAQLPGALILHMKRFKPLVSSPEAPVAQENEGIAQNGLSRIGTRAGMSYVKLTAPVSIPTELDLEPFCSSHTANAPADELGEIMDNIHELGTPRSLNKTGSAVVDRPWFLKRRADGGRVSVDIPLQESWPEMAGRKRLKGNDGTPFPAGDESFRELPVELDAEESRQVEIALSISRVEALDHDAAQEEQDLALALMLSREAVAEADAAKSADMRNSCGFSGGEKSVYDDVGGKVELDCREVATSSPGALKDLWECGAYTLHKKRSSSYRKVCDSPKPPSTPWIACSVGAEDSPGALEAEDFGEEEAVASPRLLREAPLRARYQLKGVLHHVGQNVNAGHYVTDVREVPRGTSEGDAIEEVCQWKRHDDSFVAPVSEATALEGPARRSAYICFYSLTK